MINLLGHIHKDGVSVTLNITRDRILDSNITPISICLFVYCSNGRIDCTLCQQFRFVQKSIAWNLIWPLMTYCFDPMGIVEQSKYDLRMHKPKLKVNNTTRWMLSAKSSS